MFKITTIQTVAAVAAAALLAGTAVLAVTAVLLTSGAPPANAMPQPSLVKPSLVNESLAKGVDLTRAATVPACSTRSWPNYEQGCLRWPAGDVRQVRVINLEKHGAGLR